MGPIPPGQPRCRQTLTQQLRASERSLNPRPSPLLQTGDSAAPALQARLAMTPDPTVVAMRIWVVDEEAEAVLNSAEGVWPTARVNSRARLSRAPCGRGRKK